jgi:hypothetical protein
MARTQLPNVALPRSPEDGLAASGSAFDKQFTAGTRAVGIAGERHQRNAKLRLTVALAPAEAVPGLYVHPDHRRRRRRPVVRSDFDV